MWEKTCNCNSKMKKCVKDGKKFLMKHAKSRCPKCGDRGKYVCKNSSHYQKKECTNAPDVYIPKTGKYLCQQCLGYNVKEPCN